MRGVDLDRCPLLDAERGAPLVRADREQRVDGQDVAAAGLAARYAVELPKLLERVDAHVRVGADAEADAAMEEPLHGEEAVAEVRLRRRARAHARARLAEQVELVPVGV